MTHCSLCAPGFSPIIGRSDHWLLILNLNPNLLGKCFLVVRRHIEAVPHLSAAEWEELHEQLSLTTRALTEAFQPDHFHYAFLQNQDRHVHLHVIPRYSGPRTFAGCEFSDPEYPSHYAVPSPARHLLPDQSALLAERLRQLFQALDTPGH